MAHEDDPSVAEAFSEDELETLEAKAQLFHKQHDKPLSLDHLSVGEDGSTFLVQSGTIPNYRLDERTVSVTIDEAFGATRVSVIDLVGSSDTESRLIISRLVTLEPEQFSRIEYRSGLQVSYSEHPADKEGKVIPMINQTETTPKTVSRYRPFTQGDYEDMLKMLEAGLKEQP